MKEMVRAAWRRAAFNGVWRVACNRPNIAGKYRSRPAAQTNLEEVKNEPKKKRIQLFSD